MHSPSARVMVLSLMVALSAVAAAGYAATGCVFDSASDCELTLGFGCGGKAATTSSTGTGGNTGGTSATSTSSTGTSSSGGTGGTGGTGSTTSIECSDVSTCTNTVPPGPCASLGKKACVGGHCVIEYTAGPAPSQKYGDCQRLECDTAGVAKFVPDDNDVYDDGNVCTVEACSNGKPSKMSMASGSPCTIGGVTGACEPNADPYNDKLIVCSECHPGGPNTCSGAATCVLGKCVPLHCTNNAKDAGESDVDCGGAASSCLKCLANRSCTNAAADCWSGLCMAGKCAASQCMDFVKNGDETDADCGGTLCGQPCGDGLACIVHEDCKSKVCVGNVCQAPTCTDGEQNGDEQGVDCGGAASACPPCAP